MIGARFSLHPMTDAFEPIILGAVAGLDEAPLRRESDDVSTYVSGEENALFGALRSTFAEACRRADQHHLAINLTLSRGCPGEPGEDVCDPTATDNANGPAGAQGSDALPRVACQFSLYPMGTDGYMNAIYEEIAKGGEGVEVTPQHLCTRLEGRLDAVLAQLRNAFDRAADVTPHVVIHANLSVNSPTRGS